MTLYHLNMHSLSGKMKMMEAHKLIRYMPLCQMVFDVYDKNVTRQQTYAI